MLAGFMALYYSSLVILFQGLQPYPLIKSSDAIAAYISMFSGIVLFMHTWSASEEDGRQFPKPPKVIARLLFVLLLGLGLTLAVLQPSTVETHPIDELISQSRREYDHLRTWLNTSNSLEEAVAEYHTRYEFPPPP